MKDQRSPLKHPTSSDTTNDNVRDLWLHCELSADGPFGKFRIVDVDIVVRRFWDRAPKPTAGRLRRVLSEVHCADELPEQLREKHYPTAHLPKGVLGHRRQPKVAALYYDTPLAA